MKTMDSEIGIIILSGNKEVSLTPIHLTREERVGISKLFGGGKLVEMIGAELSDGHLPTANHAFAQRTRFAVIRPWNFK